MDYIDYLNNQIQEEYKIADEMERLGITDYEEYINYIASCKEDEEIRRYEVLKGL